MIKVIIDTNVLVSAAIADKNPEVVILQIISHPEQFQWIVSESILKEYKVVLSRRRLKLSESDQQEWFNLLQDSTIITDTSIEIDFPRDRKDAKLLNCAIAEKVDYLITGDRDIEEAQELIEAKIASVSEFLELFQ